MTLEKINLPDTTEQYIYELMEWLRIPSISGDPKHDAEMKSGAGWLVDRLKRLGFKAKTMETSFHDVVYGELSATGYKQQAPTILIYGHYDVQSPEPLSEWKSDPFEPEIRDGNLYGRGTADDKGQFYTWIAALDRLIMDRGEKGLPFNIKILCEGAEEEGSKGLSEFVAENKDLLEADICVISDSHCLSPQQPVITYGLRGLTYIELTLECLDQDVHSGIYGGNVANACNELAILISKLKDSDNKIMIDGFYDEVRDLSETEVKELSEYPWSGAEIKDETGATVIVGEDDFSIAARAGARPTLDVNGIWGGFTGEGGKTIIPGKASAKISMRLVPHQDPEDIAQKFEDYIESLVPEGCRVKCKRLHGAKPVLLDRDSDYFKAAEKAYEKVFGAKPVYELSGGSIGVVADFKEILGIDSILMGYGLPDDGLHAPNEKISVEMFEKGIETNIEFFKLLSETPHKN